MKTVLFIAAFSLAGCGMGGEFVGSPHGYSGSGTIDGERFIGTPTIVPEGSSPMGYRKHPDGSVENMYSTWTDGDKTATGNAADIVAETKRLEQLTMLCAVAPSAGVCNEF